MIETISISARPIPIIVAQAMVEPDLSYNMPMRSWMPELAIPQNTFITARILPLCDAGILRVRNGEEDRVLKISPKVKIVIATKHIQGCLMKSRSSR